MYTIKEAAQRTGVSVALLRAWERRYGIVAPLRTEAGYRIYDDAAIGRIRAMRTLVADGWSPRQAAANIMSTHAKDFPLPAVAAQPIDPLPPTEDPGAWWRPPPGSTGPPSNARWTTYSRWEASSEWSTTISIQPSWHSATPGHAARSMSRASMPPAPQHCDDSGWPSTRPEVQEPATRRCWSGSLPAPAMSCLPWGSPQPFAAPG